VAAKNINIGNDVIMSWGVTISDHDSHSLDNNLRARDVVDWGQGRKNWDDIKVAEVVVENNVWIGFNAIILKGVTLGQGSIVGAGSVVTRDVPPYSVVAGNPARVIKVLDQQVKTIYE
jgi:galactoside O-acetyltransferase